MKIKKWYFNQAKKTRRNIAIALLMHGIFAAGYAVSPLLDRGWVAGIAMLLSVLIVRVIGSAPLSLLVAWPLYVIFSETAEENKIYSDYVASVFLVISIIISLSELRSIWIAT